jgi:hypothetical protein
MESREVSRGQGRVLNGNRKMKVSKETEKVVEFIFPIRPEKRNSYLVEFIILSGCQ